MPTYRKTRVCLLTSFAEGLIDEEEFLLLYDLNVSKKLDLPYWSYEKFELDTLTAGPATRFQYWGGLKKMSPTMVGRRRFFEL